MTANARFIIGVAVGIIVTVVLVMSGAFDRTVTDDGNGGDDRPGDGQTEANIRVFEPDPNDDIGLPLMIQGEARVFENTFNYRLLDSDGSILIESYGMTDAPDIGQFGPFLVTTNYPAPKGETGMLEVFEASAKDGSEINKVTIPVRFRSANGRVEDALQP